MQTGVALSASKKASGKPKPCGIDVLCKLESGVAMTNEELDALAELLKMEHGLLATLVKSKVAGHLDKYGSSTHREHARCAIETMETL